MIRVISIRSAQPVFCGRRCRAGLAPLELTLSLPILLFVMGLMVIAGTTGAWKARTDTNSRQAAWRAILPRTGADDVNPVGWPDGQTEMRLSGPGTPPISFDPWQQHQVVRGRRLTAPTGESIDVLEEALDVQPELLLGLAGIQRSYPMLASIRPEGIHPIREYPILNGDWRFSTIRTRDGRGIAGNVVRRVLHLYPSDLEGQLGAEILEYQNQAVGLIFDPDGETIDLLDRDQELAALSPMELEYEPPYGIGYAPNYFLPADSETLDNLTQPQRLCTWELDFVRRINHSNVSLRSLAADIAAEIRNVPRRLTRDHLEMYQDHLRHIERLLDLLDSGGNLPPDLLVYLQSRRPEMETNRSQLQQYIDQLESFQDSL
ncbi:MAG: hypothetical protein VB858_09825 [Planctomycetaceae bacterium]